MKAALLRNKDRHQSRGGKGRGQPKKGNRELFCQYPLRCYFIWQESVDFSSRPAIWQCAVCLWLYGIFTFYPDVFIQGSSAGAMRGGGEEAACEYQQLGFESCYYSRLCSTRLLLAVASLQPCRTCLHQLWGRSPVKVDCRSLWSLLWLHFVCHKKVSCHPLIIP